MRRLAVVFLLYLFGCSSSASKEVIVTTEGEKIEPTQIMVVDIVVQKCRVPDLKTFFEFDSDRVQRHDHLSKLARCLVRGPLKDSDVLLIGHTDPIGAENYNEELGLARAKEVANYLVIQGVAKERIKYQSLGSATASSDPKKYSKDRRVDINIIQD